MSRHPGREPYPADPRQYGPVPTERPVTPAMRRATDNAVLGAVLAAMGLAVSMWLAAGLGGIMQHGRWPRGLGLTETGVALPALLRDPAHPERAFPAEVQGLPRPGIFWGLFVCLILFWLMTAYVVGRWWTRRQAARRLTANSAGAGTVAEHLSAQAVARRARAAQPSQAGKRDQIGLLLGRDVGSGTELYAGLDDACCALGPARSGKATHLLLPALLDAPGPVVAVSNRTDPVRHTLEFRAKLGPAYVFDPYDRVPGGTRVRWAPQQGCAASGVATQRARALVAGARVADARVEAVVRCYLHALALDGRPLKHVLAWAADPATAEPARILRTSGSAADGWAEELAELAGSADRTVIWAGVRRVFEALGDARVLAACSPNDALDRFLDERATLYLVGAGGAEPALTPLLTALAQDVVERARRAAGTAGTGRLDPPLVLVLDDPAESAPLPGLPALLADGPGFGVTPVVALRSLAAARDRWGASGAGALWDAATVKLVFGGLADPYDLDRVDALTRGSGLDPRTLPAGHALLLHRNVPPLSVRLVPWWKRDYHLPGQPDRRIVLAPEG
ncbi:hypothetical protein LI90_4138 [Carbonactinospora thermoautotrophica]|uniref:TraD/TraG TraM recognition site domain-containing protein n=1 Tax=Carbonactinospora thermoautotrophica TaxID=1469144 RepID=A0A132MYW4_9ACTN|nr:type IV secretory system conjugative DNA transfer family protein [Carbonactinospora thermoautotrophica]KWX03088.1 hypothetical protein LI90_4138 [Carbonactinospora thermoautotrophica]